MVCEIYSKSKKKNRRIQNACELCRQLYVEKNWRKKGIHEKGGKSSDFISAYLKEVDKSGGKLQNRWVDLFYRQGKLWPSDNSYKKYFLLYSMKLSSAGSKQVCIYSCQSLSALNLVPRCENSLVRRQCLIIDGMHFKIRIHSSRMRTARSLPYGGSLSGGGGLCPGRVSVLGESLSTSLRAVITHSGNLNEKMFQWNTLHLHVDLTNWWRIFLLLGLKPLQLQWDGPCILC